MCLVWLTTTKLNLLLLLLHPPNPPLPNSETTHRRRRRQRSKQNFLGHFTTGDDSNFALDTQTQIITKFVWHNWNKNKLFHRLSQLPPKTHNVSLTANTEEVLRLKLQTTKAIASFGAFENGSNQPTDYGWSKTAREMREGSLSRRRRVVV